MFRARHYHGVVFVEGVGSVSGVVADLVWFDDTGRWGGMLRERGPWHHLRIDPTTGEPAPVFVGSYLRLCLPDDARAEALVQEVFAADALDPFSSTVLEIVGVTPPPFGLGSTPGDPSGVREPRRPTSPAPTLRKERPDST